MHVGPEGSTNATIALIGEGLGQQEHQRGQAFIGPSGRLLWHTLGQYNIYRPDCYITNVIPDAIIPDPLNSLPKDKLNNYIDQLHHNLKQTHCNIYIALGRTALYALTRETSIDSWRGSIMSTVLQTKCIPTLHPAYILRRPDQYVYFNTDIERAVSQSSFSQIVLPQRTLNTEPLLVDVVNFTEQVLSLKQKLTYDIETNGKGLLLCIGLSINPAYGLVVPLHGQEYWSSLEYITILNCLKSLFSSPDYPKEAHNGMFDTIGLSLMGITVKPPFDDTMYKHHVYDPASPPGIDQKSHSLATINSRHTLQPWYKDWDVTPGGKIGIPQLASRSRLDRENGMRQYCGIDVTTTRQISNVLNNKMSSAQLNFYHKHHARLQPYLLQMYHDGISIDKPKALSLATALRTQAALIEKTFGDAIGKPFKATSSKQLQYVLYDVLNLPKQYKHDPKTKQKLVTCDDNALITLYLKTQNPAILTLRDAKEQYKYASFLDPKSKDATRKRRSQDDCLRTEYRPTTKTCRLASAFSQASRTGINLQNIPVFVRQIFIPKPGYIFLEPDYRQAEAIVIAWDSLDYAMMHRFELSRNDPLGYDIHWTNAEIIMERLRSQLTKDDRTTCKHIVYGSAYLMQPPKTQETILKYATDSTKPYDVPGIGTQYAPLFIPANECKRRQDKYIASVPKLQQWQENISQILRATGTLTNAFGFTVKYHNIITDSTLKYCFGFREKEFHDTLKEALSMIPQSTIGIMCCQALMNIDDDLRANSIGHVAAQVHDSLLLEVKSNWPSVLNAFHTSKKHMEKEYTIKGNKFIVPVEFKLGTSWKCEYERIYTEEDLWNAWMKYQAKGAKTP